MTRKQAVNFLATRPVEYARMVGFTKLGDLHNGWITDMLRGATDITLQASRGTYKTSCVAVALALIIILLPNKRTLFMRKTDGDVKEVIRTVLKILRDPHTQYFVQCIYGVSLDITIASATEISTNLTTDIKGTSQLVGMGTGASITGKHFDFVFTDDIVNINDRVSKAERERTKTIYQELQNVKNRGGRIINTGTPWHAEDAFSIMPPAERYDCYHPEIQKIISEQELQELREKMVRSLFAANYELRFIPAEDVIFTDPQTGADPAILDQAKYAHIDAAYGGEDYTAFTIIKKTGGKFYVYGRLWRKHVDDVLPEIIELRKSFNARNIYCEDNGDKGYLAKELLRRGEKPIKYHESMNKFLKITSYLKAEWSNVIFVVGTDDEYIRQICDYNENAEHDDAPDSLASMVRQLWHMKESDKKPQLLW